MSLASQASLSNFTGSVAGAVAEDAGADGEEDGAAPFVVALGWPKNEVMELLALGFLAASAARSTAFRLSDILPSDLVLKFCPFTGKFGDGLGAELNPDDATRDVTRS